jgi:hypothetical protein
MATARVIPVSIGRAAGASRAGRLKRTAIGRPDGMAEAWRAAAVRPAAPAAG